MKSTSSTSSVIQQIRDDVRAELGKDSLDKGLQKLPAVARELTGKSIRAFKAIKNAVPDGASIQPFLRNIREQMGQSIERVFNRTAYELKQTKAEVMSKPPKRSGLGIEVRTGWVTAMKSDLTVVSGGFAKGQMRGAAKFYGGKERKTYGQLHSYLANPIQPSHRFSTKTTAAKEMVCFPQTRASITPKEIEDRIFQAVGDTAGAIVIQVEPDVIQAGDLKFSDECLKANLAAARRLNADARQKKIDRSITFVLPSTYGEILQRLSDMNKSAGTE
jgi:hypothetical protein